MGNMKNIKEASTVEQVRALGRAEAILEEEFAYRLSLSTKTDPSLRLDSTSQTTIAVKQLN